MTKRGIRLFPIGFIMLSAAVATGVIANAQTNAVQNPSAKALNAAEVQPAPAAVAPALEFPKRPAELPPKPPKVTCRGDQITISADNSTLDAILFAVRGCTGAKIDVPGDASRVRSFEELGPGPVREVLDELLSGTPYNYVIQSSEANPLKVETVLLSMRTNDAGKPGSNSNSNAISTDIPMTPGRRAWQKMQKFDKPDPSTLNGDDTPVEADAASPADEAIAAAASNPADPSAASASDGAPVEAAAAPAPPTPVAPPIVDPNSNADPSKAMQDRITQMQQMFAQRQQMIQKQNQGQSGGPNN
jgi:hypothetical protein